MGRFFRQLVSRVAATDPDRLNGALSLAEIRRTILPYRAHRRTLKLETSEDYELMLVRLCAGQGGYARIEPDEAQAEFAAEAESTNPDLAIVERRGEAAVILNQDQVARTLNPVSDLAFAPPEQRYAPPPAEKALPKSPRRSDASPTKTGRAAAAVCGSCGEKLPTGRKLKFCPHCGQSQALTRCPECQAELQPGWRHCVNCGAVVDEA